MRTGNRVLWLAMLIAALAACRGGTPSSTDDAEASRLMPPWMVAHRAQWAQKPWPRADVGAVWYVRHGGQDALLVDAPGGGADTLMRIDGVVICKPAGFGNFGDGRCRAVVDAGTTPRLLWAHPGNPSPNFGPPPPPPPEPAVRKRKVQVVGHDPRPPSEPLPAWLQAQVKKWGRQRIDDAEALSIERLQHHGAVAYLVNANCCDQYNTLYDADGRELCHPSGGIEGSGDRTCPRPVDPGTQAVVVWVHPGLPKR